jgi:Fe2+ or Zn2+ uptake regulation protein
VDATAWIEHTDETLRAEGLRASAGRTAVVELLARTGCLLSAQDIIDSLRADERRSASTATVYRTLETLERHGLVRRLDTKEVARYERVDPSGEHHHHVLFEDGTVEAFEDPALEAAIEGIGERLGLALTGHEVILRAKRK